jgi:hypothetical protein
MPDPLLDVLDGLTGTALVPVAVEVEVLCDLSKLDDQVLRKVLWLAFAALFLPQPNEVVLIVPHDDARVRATAKLHWLTRSFGRVERENSSISG